jgi:hypothetical protein
MAFFPDVSAQLEKGEEGWTLESADKIFLIASVDTWDAEENTELLGETVFLGKIPEGYAWYYAFEDTVFAFANLPDVKGELARADSQTTVPLFVLGLGDYLRYERAVVNDLPLGEFVESVVYPNSMEFFRYKFDRNRWTHNKREKR